ncbi:hypothetical protein BJ322DRAFT_1051819 [Thelephora terrestris]|uniref:Uncharacterized protein n=1 Tax=Thelephora terrestris TaxID=56493 RepID=A0A9P6HJM6_9AGAM|nr:hypothetical protein BJ322DRAFT_1051819 [Thelephora terrestris]
MRNILIAVGFGVITVAECGLGTFHVILTAREGGKLIPLNAFHLCLLARNHRRIEIAYVCLSLLYDTLAFFVIVFQARRSKVPGLKVPTILNTIAEDSTRYFMVIFASHFVLLMTLSFGREMIQLLPSS